MTHLYFFGNRISADAGVESEFLGTDMQNLRLIERELFKPLDVMK